MLRSVPVRSSCLCATLVALACLAAPAGGDVTPDDAATRLFVPESRFGELSVAASKSMPPQFVLQLEREMPTPGWGFEVDSVQVDPATRRILAKVSEIPPSGMTAQVITRATIEIDVGRLGKGGWILELHLRRGREGDHGLAYARVLGAS